MIRIMQKANHISLSNFLLVFFFSSGFEITCIYYSFSFSVVSQTSIPIFVKVHFFKRIKYKKRKESMKQI